MEHWKILNYRGKIYNNLLISDAGRVKNKKTGKIYKQFISKHGYYNINIFLEYDKNCSKRRQLFLIVHQAVADTFIPNPFNLPVVNHLDANKLNNNSRNLEWTTYKGNSEHAVKHNLLPSQKGENNGASKLTQLQVDEIRRTYKKYDKNFSIKALAKKYNVHYSTIHLILNNKSWNNDMPD